MKKLITAAVIATAAISLNAYAFTPVEQAGFCSGNEFMIADWAKKNNRPDLARMSLERIDNNARVYRVQNQRVFDTWAETAIKANKTIQERADMAKTCATMGL